MNEDTRQIRETTTQVGNTVQKDTEVRDSQANYLQRQSLAERIVWLITGGIVVLLSFRFALSFLGANTTNGFANFIYSFSHPFVSPFFSLFSYNNYSFGVSRFELYTLVAIVVYLIVGWGITKIVTINRE